MIKIPNYQIKTEIQLLTCLHEIEAYEIIDLIDKIDESTLIKIGHGEFGVKVMNIAKIINLLSKNINYNCDFFEKNFYKGNFVDKDFDKYKIIEVNHKQNINIFKLNFRKFRKMSLHSQIISDYKIPSKIFVDVVISPRKKILFPERNFNFWNLIIEHCLKLGLSIGVVGHPNETETFKDYKIMYSFDSKDPSKTCLEMLSSCKFYIGGDSGISHLQHNLLKPNFLFRLKDQSGPNEIKDYPKINKKCFVKLMEDNSEDYVKKSLLLDLNIFLHKYL